MKQLTRVLVQVIFGAILGYMIALILVAFSLLLSHWAVASDIVDLQQVSLSYKGFLPGGSDPLVTQNGLPGKGLGSGYSLTVNTDLFSYIYWNNLVAATTDTNLLGGGGQFRAVSWNYRFGVRLTDIIDLGYWHISQHVLDTAYQGGHFPTQDAVEVNIYLFNKKTRGESLFQ